MRTLSMCVLVSAMTACGGATTTQHGDGDTQQGGEDGGNTSINTGDDLAQSSSGNDGGNVTDAGDTKQNDAGTKSTNDAGSAPAGSATLTGLHVANGHIVNGAGTVLSLRGADHSYTEDSCWGKNGTFSDGHLTQTDLDVMTKNWHMNIVRVPLNEDCLLGINGVGFGGTEYQTALQNYVKLITGAGMAVIVDLHWNAPGSQISGGIGQLNFADADHANAFWTTLATMFASKGATDTTINSMVIFDLFNEPYLTDWNCWLTGLDAQNKSCAIVDQKNNTYAGNMAGMATMLKAVRATGAQNVVMMGGLGYSSDQTSWLTEVQKIPTLAAPNDGLTTANLAVSSHIYDFSYLAKGGAVSGLTGEEIGTNSGLAGAITAGFPFIMGETGNQMYNSASWWTGTTGLLTWIDSQKQGYTAWSWNTDTAPTLLKTFPTSTTQAVTGYTTEMGQTYYDYISKL